MSDTKVETLSQDAHVLHTSAGVFAVTNTLSTDYESMLTSPGSVDWEANPTFVQGKKMVPHGTNNDLPDIIRDIMDENNLAPGILEREMGLLHGDGPALYKIEHADGQITRQYDQDAQIQTWLNDWDYKRFIDMAMVEFKYMKGIFAKRYLNRGGRVGQKTYIKNLEVVPGTDARLEWPESGALRLESVRRIFTGDFTNNCLRTGVASYPKHDPRDPFKHRVSIGYHNKYSFGRSFYSVPSYYGSLKWIKRSSDIPDVLEHLGENGITSAFHIHSPAGYWKEKLDKIAKENPDKKEAYWDQCLDELKTEFFKNLSSVLTGKKNAGKFIETVDFWDEDAQEMMSWKVDPIDQKIGDFIESQIKISEKADSATTSGMGLHPSLSNIIVNGQLSSGSQMLYALKLYMASDTTIPEEVIFEPINQAIAANFPNSDFRMGFYHPTVNKEEDENPDDRVVNKDKKQKAS